MEERFDIVPSRMMFFFSLIARSMMMLEICEASSWASVEHSIGVRPRKVGIIPLSAMISLMSSGLTVMYLSVSMLRYLVRTVVLPAPPIPPDMIAFPSQGVSSCCLNTSSMICCCSLRRSGV